MERSRATILPEFVDLIRPYIRSNGSQEVTEDMNLVDDLNVNSARLVDIILETEDRYSIRIDDRDADRLQTVGDAVSLIIEKSSASL